MKFECHKRKDFVISSFSLIIISSIGNNEQIFDYVCIYIWIVLFAQALCLQAMEGESDDCTPEQMDSEDPLFMLYTSGSTGKPKGILHSTAGYLLYANVTFKVSCYCFTRLSHIE